MPNNITNQNLTIAPTDPVSLPPAADDITQEQIVRRRHRAQSSIASTRANLGGRAGSRATSMHGGTNLRRGAASSRTRAGSGLAMATPARPRPVLSLPEFEIPVPGANNDFADGSNLQAGFNNSGQLLQILTRADGTSQESAFSFFPSRDGPGGHRVNISEYDSSGNLTSNQSVSVLINRLANGSFNASAVDLTDPDNPVHLYNSNLTATDVTNDNGARLFNSRTTNADGSVVTTEHQAVDNSNLDYDPSFSHSYLTTITDQSGSRVLETKSITNEQGFRVTTVNDISDPDNPVLISTDTKPDPFVLSERFNGRQINDYINHIDQQGFLNISASGQATPELDLILIHRYNNGERGADLFADLDMSSATKTEAEIEAKLADGFARGVYDIDGSGSQDRIDGITGSNPVSTYDMDFLGRYMMGARGSALTDNRFANDDSIQIAADGSNIISLAEDSPILADMQEIFGVDGLSFNSAAGNLKLFFVNLSAGQSFETSGGRVSREVQTHAAAGTRRSRGAIAGGTLNNIGGAQTITRLGDQTVGFFDDL